MDSILLSFPHKANSLNAFTTADRKQPFGVIGNSTASYATTGGLGVAPAAGISFEWDGSAINNLGTSLINSGTGGTHQGDWTTNFSTLYFAATGYKPVFSDGHVYGSVCYNSASASAWITTGFTRGNYYKSWLTKTTNLLSSLGLTQMKAIYLADILINDASGTETTADINTAFRALLSFIQVDFPGTPVYMVLMGQNAAQAQSLRTTTIRIDALNTPASFSNVHYFYHGAYVFSYGGMDAADKHWNQAANDAIGRSFCDFLVDESETDWDARRIRNQFYNQLTSLQKGYVSTLISSLKSNGQWSLLNYFTTDVQTTQNNQAMDWIGVTSPRTDVGGYSFTSKSNISTDGSTTFQETFIAPLWMFLHGGQDDIFMMTKVGTNSTPAGTIGTLFGPITASGISIRQNSTGPRLEFKCNDGTLTTYTTDTKFADNTWYGVYRSSSTNKGLLKNGVSVITASVASTTPLSTLHERGARNSNPQDGLNSTYTGAMVFGQYSGFSFSTFITSIDSFNANMAL